MVVKIIIKLKLVKSKLPEIYFVQGVGIGKYGLALLLLPLGEIVATDQLIYDLICLG